MTDWKKVWKRFNDETDRLSDDRWVRQSLALKQSLEFYGAKVNWEECDQIMKEADEWYSSKIKKELWPSWEAQRVWLEERIEFLAWGEWDDLFELN